MAKKQNTPATETVEPPVLDDVDLADDVDFSDVPAAPANAAPAVAVTNDPKKAAKLAQYLAGESAAKADGNDGLAKHYRKRYLQLKG